jgi:hypothetical protein
VSTDKSEECAKKAAEIGSQMPGWELAHLTSPIDDDNKPPYKEEAQKIIATIQGAAFEKARNWGAEQFWSVESDILVPPNALKVLRQAIEFDEGYYGVAMITYPNGQFLGGRGTPRNHILEDVYDDERVIPLALANKIKKAAKEKEKTLKPSEVQIAEWSKIEEEKKSQPPRGNIFYLQSKKYRRRGWMEAAYPGIGRGAILPTDWVGLGCTLLGKKALSLANFYGYEMQGTQDLFLCWNKWFSNEIKMCVVPHLVCSHVKKTDKGIVMYLAYHESEGEFVGHLRWRPVKYLY